MDAILELEGLTKTYAGGVTALQPTNLTIRKGEIFALLGPNGAGKTTLIGLVCGLVRPSGGTMRAFGLDMKKDWRKARARIGLVPQELSVDMFEYVLQAVTHSRALFGRSPDPAKIERLLKSLSLWDKREKRISELSGGMKRRVLIAKALAHDPDLLFLDEPTAGVDVELRRDMWQLIAQLRDEGVTIILTTHYIEEAQEMADRVGVIDRGVLQLVEEKRELMARLGRTEAKIALAQPLAAIPPSLEKFGLAIEDEGRVLCYHGAGEGEVAPLLKALLAEDIDFTGIDVHESSLEDIFVDLIGRNHHHHDPAETQP
ncbi:ABC transporter ATP-binding protein [Novosphingobium sp. G106]|uniref:ABC transporter ATP-binding protein n=1 Tax=Novosphingobium sp. G106 TaxID=2849500 RepID=UPI001C2CEDC8|nr:ABC transporter ATP-binding protein [Novosphingobium sp. G106]MBV1687410.1 ABC transporter ATP-binding protein [Novosphingobium sp. G106]